MRDKYFVCVCVLEGAKFVIVSRYLHVPLKIFLSTEYAQDAYFNPWYQQIQSCNSQACFA